MTTLKEQLKLNYTASWCETYTSLENLQKLMLAHSLNGNDSLVLELTSTEDLDTVKFFLNEQDIDFDTYNGDQMILEISLV